MDAAANIIARRYLLRSLIGRGGQGDVWLADDLLLGDVVALKRFDDQRTDKPAVRREIATLRRLRLSGVVKLLDEGIDERGCFLVMENVSGRKFPGRVVSGPIEWSELASCAIQVLETLANVHAAGVIHRDLKPENVLVCDDGQPMLIDFGLALRSIDAGGTLGNRFTGTPIYAAPEQLRGEVIGSRSDLYSFGVMLYEALCGRLPHEAQSFNELLAQRLSTSPPLLRDVAPSVPEHVANVIDRLLEVEPENRPASALDVVHALRSESMVRSTTATSAYLGRDRPIRDVMHAVGRGMSVDLVGSRGSGKSRCLDELAARLEQFDAKVIRVFPGPRPFSSLDNAVGSLEPATMSLKEASRAMERKLEQLLDDRTIMLVDDADKLDSYSLQALERVRDKGRIVFAREQSRDEDRVAVRLECLRPVDLEHLFAGPNRLFHLVTDAARILCERTRGIPSCVALELSTWERMGWARRTGDLFAMDREVLDGLSVGLLHDVQWSNVDDPSNAMDGALGKLYAWVCCAYPHGTVAVLAKAMGEPQWRIEAEVNDLGRLGIASIHDDGIIEPLAACCSTLSEVERRAAHRAIALALVDDPDASLPHALAGFDGDRAEELARQVMIVAERRADLGQLGQAVAILERGLRILEFGDDALGARCAIVRRWAYFALRDRTPGSLDRVLVEVNAIDSETKLLADIEPILRAATAIMAGADRAGMMIAALEPSSDERFERIRRDLRVTAARRMAQDKLEQVLVDNERWAESANTLDARVAVMVWRGRYCYQQGQFVESAQYFIRAANMANDRGTRIIALFHAGSAWMEAFQWDDALSCGQKSRALASECRRVYDEARAEWLVRTIGYRSRTLTDADISLVDAVAEVGVPDLEALVCMTEAALLFRAGDKPGTVRLAERARRLWTAMNKRWAALCARCLALAFGAGTMVDEARALAEEAAACRVPGIGIQAIGLLARGFPNERLSWIPMANELAKLVPRTQWSERMDVLSVDDALAALTGIGAASWNIRR